MEAAASMATATAKAAAISCELIDDSDSEDTVLHLQASDGGSEFGKCIPHCRRPGNSAAAGMEGAKESTQGASSSSSRTMDPSGFRNDSSTRYGLRDALLQ